MVHKSKWIEADSPQEPVTDVARRAVRYRLELVWHFLPRAAREADEEVEHVHGLRVSTRRAMAALEIFDPYLPRTRSTWFRKQLKRARRAAGDARDLDVLGLRLLRSCPDHRAEACADLRERIRAARKEAQGPICKIHEKLADKGYKRRLGRLLEKIRAKGAPKRKEPTFAEAARTNLQPVLAEFFQAAEGDFSDTAALHQFRIQGKQLRYAMEVFADAFDASFRQELYPQVEALQEKLGKINDYASARERFQQWIDDTDAQDQVELIRELMNAEAAAQLEAQAEFVQWWTPERGRELRDRFDELLSSKQEN